MSRSPIHRGFKGLLVIGDPHIEGRQPNFRSDNYPETILKKIEFCLDYCRQHDLQPVCLGDLFDKPRDNSTWLMVRLLDLFLQTPVIGIYGNHDCHDTSLDENDSLSILIQSGAYRLVSNGDFWTGEIGGRRLVVAGSSYRQPIPAEFDTRLVPKLNQHEHQEPPLVIWLTHHDIGFKGYASGRIKPGQIDNVDVLINGHIHRKLPPVQSGTTLWLNPGNISRRSRSEANQSHVPKVLRIGVTDQGLKVDPIEVPHQPFDQVFHEAVIPTEEEQSESGFVSGLAELTRRKTESGAGLHEFLDRNLDQFEPDVIQQINSLATQVTNTTESSLSNN